MLTVIQHNANSIPSAVYAGRERELCSGQKAARTTKLNLFLELSRHRENNTLDLPRTCPSFPAEQGS